MLPSTEEEKQHIIDYMDSQAPDLEVVFLQKVYEENVLSHKHSVWDVHTNNDRWWVITNPTNLYSQEQFPNMDLAVTFHVGLCLRIPRSERTMSKGVMIAPLVDCFHLVSEAQDALLQAHDVSAYRVTNIVGGGGFCFSHHHFSTGQLEIGIEVDDGRGIHEPSSYWSRHRKCQKKPMKKQGARACHC